MTTKYDGTITTLSPLAHNSDESLGTDTKFRRIQIIHDGKTIRIPVYSGNAFRGILRRLAARQFCELLEIKKESMSDTLYYTWFTGGALQKGSAQNHIEVVRKRELRENIPFLSLFGSAVSNQIIAGKLHIGMGIPIAKETKEMTSVSSDLTIWEMLDEIFYTRRDDLEDPNDEKKKTDAAHQMKYTIEVLIPGVVLKHAIVLNCGNKIEYSCLGYVMEAMFGQGVLGGKGGTGHGKVKFAYDPEFAASKEYIEYVKANKGKILDFVKKMESEI